MSSSQTSQTAQRVRRNGSPSTTNTKQGPLKAVKTFTLKKSISANKSSSPSPRENKLWSRKSPDNLLSPERNSPSSLTHSSSNSSSLSISPNPNVNQQSQPQQQSHHCHNLTHSKEKTKSSKHSSTSGKWRPNSADNVVPSYLTGQWPKDIIHNYHHYQSSGVFMCDKSTQTADGKEQKQKLEKKKKGHRRSASFGQEDQLKYIKHHLQKSKEGSNMKQRASPVPGNHLAVSLGNHSSLSLTAPASLGAQTRSILISAGHIPRQNMNRYQRNSVEGLNVEIEKLVNPVKAVYVSVPGGDEADMVFLKEIPDGHRAPVPEANRLSSTRSVDTQTPSAPQSRPASISPGMSGTPPKQAVDSLRHSNSGSDSTDSKSSSKGEVESSPEPTSYVNSPKFVKSCPFGREPPDGCEKIHVMDEAKRPQIKSPMMCAPVMPSQFVFKQSQGSAFCPLIKHYDMPDLTELSQGLTRVLGVSCSSPVLASGMEG